MKCGFHSAKAELYEKVQMIENAMFHCGANLLESAHSALHPRLLLQWADGRQANLTPVTKGAWESTKSKQRCGDSPLDIERR